MLATEKERNKRIKKILAQKYGWKNISVQQGTGTAFEWVDIEVKVPRLPECQRKCRGGCHYCPSGRIKLKKEREIERDILDRIKKENFSEYYDDMGYWLPQRTIRVSFVL